MSMFPGAGATVYRNEAGEPGDYTGPEDFGWAGEPSLCGE